MKLNPNKTASRRKMRKAHFGATSVERRVKMSCPLAKDLQQRYGVRSMPVRKDDEVKIVRGKFGKDKLEGKVTRVYRKKYVINVERATAEKNNGSAVSVGIDASNCVITKLKIDKSRRAILERKNRNKCGKGKDKFSEDAMKDNLAGVD